MTTNEQNQRTLAGERLAKVTLKDLIDSCDRLEQDPKVALFIKAAVAFSATLALKDDSQTRKDLVTYVDTSGFSLEVVKVGLKLL